LIDLDLDALRRQLPVLRQTAYLNTGTAGPWPTPVVEAIGVALAREAELGRASPRGLPDFPPTLRATRERLANWVGAEPDELAVTGSTTIGVNIVVSGLEWRPGDQVMTSSIEHRGVLVPLQRLAARRGVQVHVAEVGTGERETALTAIRAELSERTRLVALSHVSFSTGACLPIAEIARAAHAVGALVLIDGAQAVGAMPVDVDALDVDYYALPGQKWLCGPEGTGGLFVRRARQPELAATFVGTRSAQPGAAGYEYSTLFRPGVHGLLAALDWLEGVGRHTIFDRVAQLADSCDVQLRGIDGVEVITPADARAGLVCFRVSEVDVDACVAQLSADGLTVRSVADTNSLRVSCGFFNTQAEIDRLVAAVRQLRPTGAA
jgi:L-cysteine/cystine lyase